MSSRPIRFHFRDEIVSVAGVSPTRTLLQWLREDCRATGTKEGCNEGDCGACTVVVGERDDAAPDGLRLSAVNACIQFLPTLDGKALFTVEDLAQGESLHPVQQAMVDCHGSQCGFCTPGIVMSLWADYEAHPAPPSHAETAQVLSGNLCRCTGYRPILDAAAQARELPRVTLDRAPIRAALDTLATGPVLDYQHAAQRFRAPRSIPELCEALAATPTARLLAGSTDVGLWVTKQMRTLDDLIYLGAVAELKTIAEAEGELIIGAGATLNDAFTALTAQRPEWRELAERFASVPIRNAGTLGGNVANGSPIGDSMPGLIALGARVRLQSSAGVRELPLEDFYLAYQKTALAPGEFVAALVVPRSPALFRTWKLSKRIDQDISAVCAAFALQLDGTRIQSTRIAFGGMAATPKRALACEAALSGQEWNRAALAAAQAALDSDYAPLSDMRATDAYRRQGARNLLARLWAETGADAPAALVRITEVSA